MTAEWTLLPRVVPAPRDAKGATQHADGVLRLLRVDERKSHRFSLAKKAAAFFSISRSSLRTRFSLRRAASSFFSSLVRASGAPLPASTRACSTHARRPVG